MTKITVTMGARGFTANWDLTSKAAVLDLLEEIYARLGWYDNKEAIYISSPAARAVVVPPLKLRYALGNARYQLGYHWVPAID